MRCRYCKINLDEDGVCPQCGGANCQSCGKDIDEDRVEDGWMICEECVENINREINWEERVERVQEMLQEMKEREE